MINQKVCKFMTIKSALFKTTRSGNEENKELKIYKSFQISLENI